MDAEVTTERPEHVGQIAGQIQTRLGSSISEIREVHERSHVLSINARIEAARSGAMGVGFRIVAEEFSRLNNEIALISHALEKEIQEDVVHLQRISDRMARQVRGQRLSQVALGVIDVIDRNLYERSCDVRWWATDKAVVDAVSSSGTEVRAHASSRLGEILASYTVYLDLVLADHHGEIVANGRPGVYPVQGRNVDDRLWFRQAMASPDGSEYCFESMHSNPLVKDRQVLVYSCRVGRGERGAPLGVLGIVFDWEKLAASLMDKVCRIDLREDREVLGIPTSVSVMDRNGRILASTDPRLTGTQAPGDIAEPVLARQEGGFLAREERDGVSMRAWAWSPGFETYASGWYCLITQQL